MSYTKRRILGWTVLIVLSLLPVYFLFEFGSSDTNLLSYSSITHTMGEVFGLVGMTMFALTFVLSTRIKWIEDVFGGLDKVYLAHGILGGTALMVILAHPIFLVLKFIPSDFVTAAGYLIPSSYWSVNFGIIAILGMMLLIGITLFSKMKYHTWKFTHEFLGLIFFFAVLHIFLVKGDASKDNIFVGYYIYASIISSVGLLAFSYSLFVKSRIVKNAVYKIESISNRKDIFEIVIVPEHKPISYKSGQFVFLRFYNRKLSREAHPFSIASRSDEYRLKIVIKKLGDYTNKMEHLAVGDKVSIEGPYGRFHFRNYKDDHQVWIAAGIGITPFMGMAQDIDRENIKSGISLYYAAKNIHEFVGYELFKDISARKKNFIFIPWSTEERGRIEVEDILRSLGSLKDKQFLICGSSSFKESIVNGLVKSGVKKSTIHEEAFDFR